MHAKILTRHLLADIPSASGIEAVGEDLWIIGDDSPHLFRLDTAFRVQDTFSLLDGETRRVIPKKEKPDFEALALLEIQSRKHLLILGSGSLPARETAVLFDLHTFTKTTHSLHPLYAALRKPAWIGDAELNIEAAVATDEKLFLFQRGNITGRNVMFEWALTDFTESLLQHKPLPVVPYFLTLPNLNGCGAGFSAACWKPYHRQVLFAASVENTPNAIDDGEVLGSFIGILKPDDFNTPPQTALLRTETGDVFKGKVEGIAHFTGNLAFAVTDSDGGDSELLTIEVTL